MICCKGEACGGKHLLLAAMEGKNKMRIGWVLENGWEQRGNGDLTVLVLMVFILFKLPCEMTKVIL